MFPRLDVPLPFGKSLPVHGYGLMIVLGFFLSLWVAQRESRRRGLPDFVYDMGLVMLLCGLLGGRLFYFLQHYSDQFRWESPLEFFKIWKGGLVFYGGAFGGLAGAAAYLWAKGHPVGAGLDVAATGAPVGMAFGRLGCFLNGCCYGRACDPAAPVGVAFPPDSAVQQGQWDRGLLDAANAGALPVQPAQLYQAAHDLLLCVLLLAYFRQRGSVQGAGMPLLLCMYGLGRFALEYLRGDHPASPGGWTVSQNISVACFAGGLGLVVWLLVRARYRLTKVPRKG